MGSLYAQLSQHKLLTLYVAKIVVFFLGRHGGHGDNGRMALRVDVLIHQACYAYQLLQLGVVLRRFQHAPRVGRRCVAIEKRRQQFVGYVMIVAHHASCLLMPLG